MLYMPKFEETGGCRTREVLADRCQTPSEPHMCAECEDSAEGEIVLDTARGCAYYSILRQARKRLSEPRDESPAGGNLENRILDRRNHFLLLI